MRSPEIVLKSLNEKACVKGYRFERLYRNLYNPEFYLTAYQNIAKSQGSMTPGVDGITLDGMSMARISRIINSLKNHSYRPNPARRVYIEKKNSSKKRPLGIPSNDDKLVQEVVRMILEAIYEPNFASNSHGFRPGRSCHTALNEITAKFTGVNWMIEGDIKACFDSFDHHVLIDLLRRRIQDEYFISLMWKFLRAGYLEQWNHNVTYSGTPQGSGMSPILANIYLHELDVYVMNLKTEFDTAAEKRTKNRAYVNASAALRYAKKRVENNHSKENVRKYKSLQKAMMAMPSKEVKDENYKRIQYNRYADDFLIGVIGSKEDAVCVKAKVKAFLTEKLKLTMSEEKTRVTHSSALVRYLGYDVTVSKSRETKRCKQGLRRVWAGSVFIYIPHKKWASKLLEYKAIRIVKGEDGKETWKAIHRNNLLFRSEVKIISKYNAEIRGLYNFYRLASNVYVLNNFFYMMRNSCFKTFASKYRTKTREIRHKYIVDGVFGVNYMTKAGEKRCEFYHDGFTQNKSPAPAYTDVIAEYRHYAKKNSLAGRIRKGICEMCMKQEQEIHMHHVKKLKDLTGNKPSERLMMEIRRKSLALCEGCYEKSTRRRFVINAAKIQAMKDGEPDTLEGVSPVREEEKLRPPT